MNYAADTTALCHPYQGGYPHANKKRKQKIESIEYLKVSPNHPPSSIAIRKSAVAGMGAFATEIIPKGTTIVEYTGRRLTPDEADRKHSHRDYLMLIQVSGKTESVIDAANKKNSSCARFINCARFEEEQNVIFVQRNRRMWVKVQRDIAPGEELLVSYGDEYTYNLLGYSTLPLKSEWEQLQKSKKYTIAAITKSDKITRRKVGKQSISVAIDIREGHVKT
jgi:SET domain-containing protein